MEDIYTTRLMQVGTSKGVVIPVQIIRALNWERGDLIVVVAHQGDKIILRKVTDAEVLQLKQVRAEIQY